MKLIQIDSELGRSFFKKNAFNSPFELVVFEQPCNVFVTLPSEYFGNITLLDSGIKCESPNTDRERLFFAKCLRNLSADLNSPVIYFHEFMDGPGFNGYLATDTKKLSDQTFYRFRLNETSLEKIAEVSSCLHADKLFFGFITDEAEDTDQSENKNILIVFLECFDNEYEIIMCLNPVLNQPSQISDHLPGEPS
jgi:hypothetical protein